MSDDESPPKKDGGGGAPAWMATFADLMSLLLAFFVLLFSFSDPEPALYKVVGGSIREAFGVQRNVIAKDPVLGTSIIAIEYNGGPPTERNISQIMQIASAQFERFLKAESPKAKQHVVQEMKGLVDTMKKMLRSAADGEKPEDVDLKKLTEAITKADKEAAFEHLNSGGEVVPSSVSAMMLAIDAIVEQEEEKKPVTEDKQKNLAKEEQENLAEEDLNVAKLEDNSAKETVAMKNLEKELDQLKEEFQSEFDENLYNLEVSGEGNLKQFKIRLAEESGFETAKAELSDTLKVFVGKLSEKVRASALSTTVIGHTDARPIRTVQYKSNWELSAARAASVVRVFIEDGEVSPDRLSIKGLAAMQPIASNETPEGQAQNRRVEIIIHSPGTY